MHHSFEKGNKLRVGLAPWNKGIKWLEMKGNTNGFKKGQPSPMKGKKLSIEHRKKLSLAKLGRVKELASNWKGGISKNHHSVSEPKYKEWRISVFKRDNSKCKINNADCKGHIQPHHILPWRDFPELRYEVNNGITLCLAHHPRKWAEEKRLSPYFIDLVSVSKE